MRMPALIARQVLHIVQAFAQTLGAVFRAEIGEDVEEGQGVVVIEAMKMQNELKSPKAGRVVRVGAGVGDTVGSGDVLVVVE